MEDAAHAVVEACDAVGLAEDGEEVADGHRALVHLAGVDAVMGGLLHSGGRARGA